MSSPSPARLQVCGSQKLDAQYRRIYCSHRSRHSTAVNGFDLWKVCHYLYRLRNRGHHPCSVSLRGQQIHSVLPLFVRRKVRPRVHSFGMHSQCSSSHASSSNQVCVSIAAIRTTKALRIDFIKHILRQNIAYFDSDSAASVTTQATTNGNNVNNGISEKLTLTIQGVSTFVSAFIIAFIVQWKLTLITISIVPTILIVTSICVVIDTKNENELLAIYSKAGLLAEEVFSTIRTVHAFWLNPLLSRKYDKLLGDAMSVGMKKSPNYAVLFSSEFFCVYCGYGLAFWQGVRMYARGEIKESGRLNCNHSSHI